jgi:hypothetical protein
MNMKKHLGSIAAFATKRSLLLAGLFALIVTVAIAADLTYTALPQDSDSPQRVAQKHYVAQSSNLFRNSTAAIAAGTASTIKSASGVLEGFVINTGAAGTATLYNNASGTGSKIAVINTASQGSLRYGLRFDTGLSVVQTGTADITIVYR